MERNDIENINSNQSKQCSYGGAKRSDRGGAHGGGAGLHPSLCNRYERLGHSNHHIKIMHKCIFVCKNPYFGFSDQRKCTGPSSM